jgi:hypothetical protein
MRYQMTKVQWPSQRSLEALNLANEYMLTRRSFGFMLSSPLMCPVLPHLAQATSPSGGRFEQHRDSKSLPQGFNLLSLKDTRGNKLGFAIEIGRGRNIKSHFITRQSHPTLLSPGGPMNFDGVVEHFSAKGEIVVSQVAAAFTHNWISPEGRIVVDGKEFHPDTSRGLKPKSSDAFSGALTIIAGKACIMTLREMRTLRVTPTTSIFQQWLTVCDGGSIDVPYKREIEPRFFVEFSSRETAPTSALVQFTKKMTVDEASRVLCAVRTPQGKHITRALYLDGGAVAPRYLYPKVTSEVLTDSAVNGSTAKNSYTNLLVLTAPRRR